MFVSQVNGGKESLADASGQCASMWIPHEGLIILLYAIFILFYLSFLVKIFNLFYLLFSYINKKFIINF